MKSKHNTILDYFKKINANSAYIIGFILGDGQIGVNDSGNYFLRINLHEKDVEILEFIIKEISPTRNINSYKYTQKSGLVTPYKYIKITSNELLTPLIKLGIVPRKTGKEIFPDIPKKYIPDFLRGLFDADGSLAIKNKKSLSGALHYGYVFTYTCASKQLLEDIKTYFGFGKIEKSTGCFKYVVNRLDDIEKIGKIFYYNNNNFSLKRKKDRFDKIPKKTKYTAFGEIKTLMEWYRDSRCIVSKDTIRYRINHTQLSFEECISLPQKSKTKDMYARNKNINRKHVKNIYYAYGENK